MGFEVTKLYLHSFNRQNERRDLSVDLWFLCCKCFFERIGLFAEQFDLVQQRLACVGDAFQNLFAAVLDGFGPGLDVVEGTGPFFDFENGFIHFGEVGLSRHFVIVGADAQGAGQREARNYVDVFRGILCVSDDNDVVSVAG